VGVGEEPEGAGFVAGFPVGSQLAGYRLEQRIGQGGMAVVFRAWDERLQRQVALKVLAPALAADEGFRHRFIRESRSAAAVDDPHIIPIYEAGEQGGVLFIAMRYVASGDAGSLVRRAGPLPPARAAAIIGDVAAALDAAHAAGLVHRDIKPANMLVDVRAGRRDHVYLSDFGLTTGALSSVGLTGLGQFVGTLDYAAPEQIEGRDVGPRTDEYSLACAAFELLSGEPPFRRGEGMAVLYAQLSAAPPSLAARRPGLPPGVDEVVHRALAKAAGDRFASCGEFAAALRSSLGLPQADIDGTGSAPGHPLTEVAGIGGPGWAATATAAPRPGPGGVPGAPAGREPAGHLVAGAGQPGRRAGHRRAGLAVLGGAVVLAAAGIGVGVTLASSAGPGASPAAKSGAAGPAASAPAGRASSPAAQTGSPKTTGSPGLRPGHSVHPAAVVPAIVRAFRDPGTGARHVNSVAFNADGGMLATGDADGNTYTWEAGTGRLVATLPDGGDGKVFAVAFSPGGTTLATGYANGSTRLWQAGTGQLLGTLSDPGGSAVDSVAFSPDGTTLATGDKNGQTYLWQVIGAGTSVTLARTLPDPGGGGVWAVAFSPDGQSLATADFNGSTYLWDTSGSAASPAATFTVPGGHYATAVAFSPDGATLATGNFNGDTYLWNLRTGAHTVIPKPGTVWAVAYSRDGTLAIGDADGAAYLRAATATGGQGSVLADPASGSEGVGALAFSADGRQLAAGDSNGTTYLWRAR
jgi:Protein kinase domain/WD domain, G-beta repeat